MKKLLTAFIFSGVAASSHAQQVMDLFVENGQPFRGNTHVIDATENASGTAYVYEGFKPATISNVKQTVTVRYNAMADNVEVANGKTYFILPKRPEYGKIDISNNEYKIRLVDYVEEGKTINGFLFEIFSNESLKLYKKEKVKLIAGRESSNTYERSIPPKLLKTKDTFFMQQKNGTITQLPDDKKGIIALFPDKKNELTNFFKTEKTSFKDEQDLVKLAQFLATL